MGHGTWSWHGTHGHHLLLVTPFLSLTLGVPKAVETAVLSRFDLAAPFGVDFLDGVVHNELIPRLLGNLDLLVERDYLFREGYLNDLRGGHLGEHLVLEHAEVFRAQPSPP